MLEPKGALKAAHDIILNSREKLRINGVKEILNFDENRLALYLTIFFNNDFFSKRFNSFIDF